MVRKYSCEVVTVENPVTGVYTVEFASLAGRFRYKPGQFMHLALDEYDPSGAWPDSRCFSMQTSPQTDTIKITYAVKGAFTQRMESELQPGKQLWLKLPYGDLFTQEHNKENTVFIAGGTGITPYLSLFTDESFAVYAHPVLYLGCRDASYNFYRDELNKAQQINPNLECRYCYQNQQGMLNIEQIIKDSDSSADFFISGPPAMIIGFRSYLMQNGVTGEQIKTDDWE